VALADIVRRISDDAEREAAELVLAAEKDAEQIRHDAQERAARERGATLASERGTARDEAATLLAGARLGGRDRLVAEKHVLIDRVLENVVRQMQDLPDSEYAELIARGVAEVARGDEIIVLSRADEPRLRTALPEMLSRYDLKLSIEDSTGDAAQGVALVGKRTRVEVSPAAMVEARRAEMVSLASRVLFDEAEG
jgi:V/A-type H+-transporting ATPase subunit E